MGEVIGADPESDAFYHDAYLSREQYRKRRGRGDRLSVLGRTA
jgi:hypothetical protein